MRNRLLCLEQINHEIARLKKVQARLESLEDSQSWRQWDDLAGYGYDGEYEEHR